MAAVGSCELVCGSCCYVPPLHHIYRTCTPFHTISTSFPPRLLQTMKACSRASTSLLLLVGLLLASFGQAAEAGRRMATSEPDWRGGVVC